MCWGEIYRGSLEIVTVKQEEKGDKESGKVEYKPKK